MANNQSDRTSMGVCEKIYNAITVRPIHRISNCMPTNTAPNPSLPTPYPTAKAHNSQSKPVDPHQPSSGEVIPVQFEVAKVTPKIEPTGHANGKEDKAKPTLQKTQPTRVIGQGHGQVGKAAPARVIMLDETKPRANMVDQPEKDAVGSGHGQVAREAKPPNVSVQEKEKPKDKVETAPPSNNVVVMQSHGKPKGEVKISGPANVNDKFADFINRTKKKMRTTSNVGGGKSGSKLDSFNDRVSNYINRAKLKIRTTSNVGGGGKSVSFKEE